MGNKKYIIVGTSGHIDHGKSSVVKALTGVDPDRLAEEKSRGITIDLGFGSFDAGDMLFSFVDVPGHEKYVKNMIAGASGFDICLLAVDIAEGVKPQTIEHLNIVNFLGVGALIVVFTKYDLVIQNKGDKSSDVKKILSNYSFPIVEYVNVSIFQQESITNLKNILIYTAERINLMRDDRLFLMNIDRSFIIKGHGTVVTGTVMSGSISKGDIVDIHPLNKRIKIKSITEHGNIVDSCFAGQRAGLNLSTVQKDEVYRGCVITNIDMVDCYNEYYASIEIFDSAKDDFDIKNNSNHPIHIGSDSFYGKFIIIHQADINGKSVIFCKIKAEHSYPFKLSDKFLVRGGTPQTTTAGGIVLSVLKFNMKNYDKYELLVSIFNGKYSEFIRGYLAKNNGYFRYPKDVQLLPANNVSFDSMLSESGTVKLKEHILSLSVIEELKSICEKMLNNSQVLLDDIIRGDIFPQDIKEYIEYVLISFFQQNGFVLNGRILNKGNVKSEIEILAENALDKMNSDFSIYSASSISSYLGTSEKDTDIIIKMLNNKGMVKKIADGVFVSASLLNSKVAEIISLAKSQGFVDIINIKVAVEAPRKVLISMLEYLDTTGKFILRDKKRVLKIK